MKINREIWSADGADYDRIHAELDRTDGEEADGATDLQCVSLARGCPERGAKGLRRVKGGKGMRLVKVKPPKCVWCFGDLTGEAVVGATDAPWHETCADEALDLALIWRRETGKAPSDEPTAEREERRGGGTSVQKEREGRIADLERQVAVREEMLRESVADAFRLSKNLNLSHLENRRLVAELALRDGAVGDATDETPLEECHSCGASLTLDEICSCDNCLEVCCAGCMANEEFCKKCAGEAEGEPAVGMLAEAEASASLAGAHDPRAFVPDFSGDTRSAMLTEEPDSEGVGPQPESEFVAQPVPQTPAPEGGT